MPKGRLYNEVILLLKDAGFNLSGNSRNYRPTINDPKIEVKILKSQNIPKLVELGSQDIAFTGYDWVVEQNADVQELMDLGFNPVKLVACAKEGFDFKKPNLRVASEYESLSRSFMQKINPNFIFIKSFGATEVFIPEDADIIVDNSSSGATLKENDLQVMSTVLTSSTRLIANKKSLKDKFKKKKIGEFVLLLKSALEGRERVLIEMNVPKEKLKQIIPSLPCMKSPTISKLYSGGGYAIKIAVKKQEVNLLIPLLKEKGATDILVFSLQKVVL
ncbi:MAG: ATP phosphoribosyltransferase [Candidatus Micrarchaeota archaeon]